MPGSNSIQLDRFRREAVIANAMADVGVRAKGNPRRGGFKGAGLTTRLPVAFTLTKMRTRPAQRRLSEVRGSLTHMGTATGRSSAVVGRRLNLVCKRSRQGSCGFAIRLPCEQSALAPIAPQ
jgi:hypothetical protein